MTRLHLEDGVTTTRVGAESVIGSFQVCWSHPILYLLSIAQRSKDCRYPVRRNQSCGIPPMGRMDSHLETPAPTSPGAATPPRPGPQVGAVASDASLERRDDTEIDEVIRIKRGSHSWQSTRGSSGH